MIARVVAVGATFAAMILAAAVPAGAAPESGTVVARADRAVVDHGGTVVVSGRVSPVRETTLSIEQQDGSGAWHGLATTTSAARGTYAAPVRLLAPGELRVRAIGAGADPGAVSRPFQVAVRPVVRLRRAEGPVLVGARLTARVRPVAYTGVATVVAGRGRDRTSSRARVRDGALSVRVRTSLGTSPVRVTLPATGGFAATAASGKVRGTARRLTVGARGPDVRALVARLRQLRFHTPGPGRRYSAPVSTVVLAFQKSQGMPRTGVTDKATWRRVLAAEPLRARYRGHGLHIEVDKTRQILMVVRDGRVAGAIHVSTGATGNTPEGRFRIYQKGGSYLYRFMAFHGNFGIHGYVPVPAYPASHGCVREPMWAAAWTYARASIGTEVIVYH